MKNQFINICILVTLLGSNSRMAPALGDDLNGFFLPGNTWTYRLLTTVLLNEPGAEDKDVGFHITADIKVESVWVNPTVGTDRLFKIEVINPRLHIKSRKAPSPEGFVEHSSRLEELSNSPFFVHWNNGKVKSLYIPMKESVSLVNLKKGIASLFQFQMLDVQVNETDASGLCTVTYQSISPLTFTKTKTFCQASEDTPYLVHPDQIFSVDVKSNRESTYEMSGNLGFIQSIKSSESHVLTVKMKPEAGYQVKITQEIQFKDSTSNNPIVSDYISDVIQKLTNQVDSQFTHETLSTEREVKMCQDSVCPDFSKLVADNLKIFEDNNYGSLKTANAFLKTINAAREANKDEIVKVLKKKQNKPALLTIYDILGSAQTLEAHEAAMKQLKFTEDKHLNRIERYLWSLSMGSQPKHDVIEDLLKRYYRTQNLGEKLQETLILTVASMTNKYIKNPHNIEKNKIYQNVKEAIYNGIYNCKGKPCEQTFIRALQNLKSPETIPKLIEIALTGADKSSVLSMKALKSFPSIFYDETVINTSKTIFFQLKKKHDSSSRTLALDILLENPTEEIIQEILHYLLTNDKSFEVKRYVIQKLSMLAEKDDKMKDNLKKVLRNNSRLHNYSILSQKGLSTALSRKFMEHNAINGSMISVQEMNSGLVKRGVFDIVLEENGNSCEMFSLGLFSSGLSSFISSDDEESNSEETATAGMELMMLGTQIRPFVFFSGQGELMGHVWSGTASESTPAFQINTLIHDHLEYLRLGPGLIAELNLQSAVSFNLAGEIQISLWNRNSHTLVNQNAAVIMNGLLRVDTSFVQSKVEFLTSLEPKLDLESDIEFGSGVLVCLRLNQPGTLFKHNIYKVERIPGSKHRLRKAKYKKFEVPGRTYNLNRKNNEMCNILLRNR